jgi:hypothetical protein
MSDSSARWCVAVNDTISWSHLNTPSHPIRCSPTLLFQFHHCYHRHIVTTVTVVITSPLLPLPLLQLSTSRQWWQCELSPLPRSHCRHCRVTTVDLSPHTVTSPLITVITVTSPLTTVITVSTITHYHALSLMSLTSAHNHSLSHRRSLSLTITHGHTINSPDHSLSLTVTHSLTGTITHCVEPHHSISPMSRTVTHWHLGRFSVMSPTVALSPRTSVAFTHKGSRFFFVCRKSICHITTFQTIW